MVTLRFSKCDYDTLLILLGFALSAAMKDDALMPQNFKEVIDWTILQGSSDNYIYWHNKNLLKNQKEAELLREASETTTRRETAP